MLGSAGRWRAGRRDSDPAGKDLAPGGPTKSGLDRSSNGKGSTRPEGDVDRLGRDGVLCRKPLHAGRYRGRLRTRLVVVSLSGNRLARRLPEFGQAIRQIVGAAVVQGYGTAIDPGATFGRTSVYRIGWNDSAREIGQYLLYT